MVAVLGDGHCLFRAVGKPMVVHPGAVWSWVAAAIAQIGVAGIASLIPGENDAEEWCAHQVNTCTKWRDVEENTWTWHKPGWGLLDLAPVLLGQIHF
jgi:hypothetical protein